jgi:hypothetical protein
MGSESVCKRPLAGARGSVSVFCPAAGPTRNRDRKGADVRNLPTYARITLERQNRDISE